MCIEDDEGCARKYGRWFVVGVTLLIIFVPVTTHLFIFNPWLAFHSAERNFYAWVAPFDFSVVLIWLNYYLGCTTEPGRVPTKFKPIAAEGRKPRWCKECKNYKPLRAHHCSICRRCVLKMDHHCPWLNNCIGHNNHAHFVRFICSVTSGVIACLALISLRMWDVIRYHNALSKFHLQTSAASAYPVHLYTPQPDLPEIIFMLANLIICFALLLTVGILALWQLYYALSNMTTIESFEISKLQTMAEKGQLDPKLAKFPFDNGSFKNFQSLFGEHWIFWWVPKKADGNGLFWETNRGEETVYEWPPREYFYLKKHPDAVISSEIDKELRRRYGKHVRTGSEGYLVKELSYEDRERMLDKAINNPNQDFSPDYDSDYDSLEVTDDEGYDPAEPAADRVGQSDDDVPVQTLANEDDDSDEEVLGLRRRRL